MSRTSPDVPGTWEHGDPGQPEPLIVDNLLNGPAFYTQGGAKIILAREPAGKDGAMLWHLSISRPNRHPSWDDIKAARYRLLPHNLDFAVLLPPPGDYVNVPEQDHVFHVWEIVDVRRDGHGL